MMQKDRPHFLKLPLHQVLYSHVSSGWFLVDRKCWQAKGLLIMNFLCIIQIMMVWGGAAYQESAWMVETVMLVKFTKFWNPIWHQSCYMMVSVVLVKAVQDLCVERHQAHPSYCAGPCCQPTMQGSTKKPLLSIKSYTNSNGGWLPRVLFMEWQVFHHNTTFAAGNRRFHSKTFQITCWFKTHKYIYC